jgi:hypothetical protein
MHGSDGESMSDQESLQASSARGWEEAESISDISRAGVDYAKYADELEAEEACGLIGRDGHPLPFATDAYMNNRKKENKIFFVRPIPYNPGGARACHTSVTYRDAGPCAQVDDMQLYHERENLPLVPYESLQVCPLRTAGAQRQGPAAPAMHPLCLFLSSSLSHSPRQECLGAIAYSGTAWQFRHVMGAPGWQPGGRFAHHHDSDHLVASMQKREKVPAALLARNLLTRAYASCAPNAHALACLD